MGLLRNKFLMRYWGGFLVAISLLLSIVSAVISYSAARSPQVQAGLMELRDWDFTRRGPVQLNGAWTFYPQQLLTPGELAQQKLWGDKNYPELPSSWNPAYGYGTFHLTIRLPAAPELMAIRLPSIYTAHKLWINGRLVSAGGLVGMDRAHTQAQYFHKLLPLPQTGGQLELVLQVSNFQHRNGGVRQPLTIGTYEQLNRSFLLELVNDMAATGGLIIMGIYHFILYSLQKQQQANIYFGLFCILIGARIPFIDQISIMQLFPALPQEWALRFEYLTFFLALPTLFGYLASLFPAEISARLLRVTQAASVLYCLFMAFAPLWLTNRLIPSYQVLILCTFFYLIYALMQAVKSKRTGARWTLAGSVIFLLAATNDILYTHGLSTLASLSPLGLCIFILTQSNILASRLAHACQSVEALTAKLLQMDKLKNEFLANVSHELHTPLHGIIGIAETLADGAAGSLTPEQKYNLLLIESSARRLSQLVKNLLEFSRLQHGDIVLQITAVSVKPLVQTVLDVCRPLAGGKDLKLLNQVPDGLPAVNADEDRLQQILYNLIGNAIKFSSSGTVAVSAAVYSPDLVITVADTGCGISPERQQDVFLPFIQLDPACKSASHTGLGLGLNITRKLVEQHGGNIWLQSKSGNGTIVRFTLPLSIRQRPEEFVQAEIAATSPFLPLPEQPAPGRSKPAATILLVDDEPVNCQVMFNYLKSKSYRLFVAVAGSQALKLLAKTSVDLIILDITLPDISGYEVCRTLRTTYTLSELPVLILSVKSRQEDIVQAFEAGANDYLTKPVNKEEILARVNTLLALKRATSQLVSAEMLFLQAQIRPHFIHNAITAIMSLCRTDPEQAIDLLSELSIYLRGKFNFNTDKPLRLAEELELVRSYLAIEEVRLGSRLRTEYDIEPGLEDRVELLPLIIQPLVENAVRHGIYPKLQGGTVSLTIRSADGGGVIIQVADDGVGIDAGRLALLLQGLDQSGGVGLRNVYKRLLVYYGNVLTMESSLGLGTLITIQLPAIKLSHD